MRTIETEVLRYFLTQGPWAVTTIVLGYHLLKQNKELRSTLDKFGDIIKVDLTEIKSKLK
jgi:hypothetical protein